MLHADMPVNDIEYHQAEANHIETRFQGNTARILGIEGTFDKEAYDRLFRG